MSYTVVCFYTYDTPYEEEAKQLKDSCIKFGIPVVIYGYQTRGSWVKNAGIKAGFLSRVLDELQTDILYLDADARVRQPLDLFKSFKADIGVHYRDGKELLSGTIYLRNNDAVKSLIKDWLETQSKNPDSWDQKILQAVLPKHNLDVFKLPATYCCIFDKMRSFGPPVIEHMQASRRLKQLITFTRPVESVIDRQSIRKTVDGGYYLARRNAKAEAYLDSIAERIETLRWRPRKNNDSPLESLKPFFEGRRVYIIGKGPSLDALTLDYFKNLDAPIIAINEAIHKVESLWPQNTVFGLQQDLKLTNTCRPLRAAMLVETKASNFYADYQFAYVFDNRLLGLPPNALSVAAAIKIALRFGATGFVFISFDACVNTKTAYAECIGSKSSDGGEPSRFLKHRKAIESYIGNSPAEWITPS